MLRRAACLLLILLMCAVSARAQRTTDDGLRQPRILLLLDGSSSMLQPWNNTIRFKAAGRLISRLMDSIYTVNAGVEFGLRVYGHQSPAQINDCFDSRMEVMFSKKNAVQMGLRLASLHPFGVSPIAYSLKEAAENDLADEVRNAYSVILITDGGESCGGNICDVVKTLIDRKISFKPYILSLINYAPLKEQYACLGTYLQVANDAEMGPAINRIVEDYRPMLSMPIMAARTEPAAPKPAMAVVNIPAWVPDRSPVATLVVTVPRITTLPVYYASRPAPRRMIVPRPAPIPKPDPEPVIIPTVRTAEVALARITSNTRPVMIRVAHSNPVPRRRTLPTQAPFPKPEPAVRTTEANMASISSNTRPVMIRVAHSNPVPRRRTLPTQAPFPKPEPAVRTTEANMASISSNTRPTTMRIVHANPVPRRMNLPAQPPFPKPEPAVRTTEANMASISSNTRPTTMRIVHANPVPRRMNLPAQPSFPKPEPAVRTAEANMASISSNTRPTTMRIVHANPVPRRMNLPAQPPFPKPEPAVRTAEANMASISSNTRPTTMRIVHANPVPRRMNLPAQPPFPKPEPAVRTAEANMASISSNTRPTTMRIVHANPVPRRMNLPAQPPFPKPEPAVRTAEANMASISSNTRPTTMRIVHANPVPRRMNLPAQPPFPKPEPAVRTAEANMASISSNTRPATMRIVHANPVPRRKNLPALAPFPKPLPEPVVKRDTVAAIKPAPATAPRVDTAKSTVVIKRIDPPVTTTPKPKQTPKAVPDNTPKETTFTSEREDAKETSLSILFTDGRGKFYASTPQLQLMDAVTGKMVKQFYRTVDAAGNPDPQTVPAGTYNLLVAGRANMLMRRIVVEKDKHNRIIVKVAHGSLRFRYEDAPDRPVTEFDAIVNIRFEPGPTVKQRCTAELEYAPGNYYIEINTMPVSRFNTDIDFGAITEIQIPQPGYVQFTNKAPLGTVSLFTPLGNKFVRFYGLRITGDPENQRLRLRPGLYEVHWVKNPSVPFATETVERFLVKSNSVTEVELQ